jgi:hypothetical protein
MMEENSSQPLAVGEVAPELKEQLKCREALCEAMKNIPPMPPEAFRAEIARIRSEYEASVTPPPEYAEVLDKEFAAALQNAEAGVQKMETRQLNLQTLEAELQRLLADELLVKNDLDKFDAECVKLLGEVPEQFKTASAPVRERIAAEEAQQAAETAQAEALMEELKNLADAEDVAPLRERKGAIDAQFKELTHLPQPVRKRFLDISHKASLKITQFFEELDLARWESYTLKQDICARIEAMNSAEKPDCVKFAKELQELRDKWKTLGSVPKEKTEEINARYLECTRQLQHKVDEFFSNRRQERKQAAADKSALIAEAEAIANSTEWNVTAAAFKELQAKWKTIPRAGNEENALYQKFRAAADTFFNARSAYFTERDKKVAAVVERKEALIAEAEALTQNDLRRARQLREDFRNAGNAGKFENALFERLKAALDKFFNERRAAFSEKENESRTLIAELEQLTSDPAANTGRAREIKDRLAELDSRETAAAVKTAVAKFENALKETRKQETRAKGDLVREVARDISAAAEKALKGETFEFTPPAAAEMFPKLSSAAKLIADILAGDTKSVEKLNRHLTAAGAEHDRICSELEKLSGKEEPEEENLAAVLQAAIMGNFAKAEAKAAAQAIDPNKLASEYLNAGLLLPEALEASFVRFDAAMSKL